MLKLSNKKFKKYTSLSLASAVMLSAVPAAFAETPAVANTEAQAEQTYLASADGIFTAKATAETVNLPFSNELYYGYELLNNANAKKAWEVIIRELLAYNPTEKHKGVSYSHTKKGQGTITINLKELGVNVAAHYVSGLRNNLVNSDPRLFHLSGGSDVRADKEGMAESITFYVEAGYSHDAKYQQTLLKMEDRASQILSVVDTRMTDAQKVAAIYNKFISMTNYVENNGHWIMTGPLLEGGGICGGYSYAFQYLLQRAGIEAIWARDAGHAWNYVKVDGEWYFADSTWEANHWLLLGQSSLKSHKPWNTYGKIPTLATADYDRQALKFDASVFDVVEEEEEVVTEEQITAEAKLEGLKEALADLKTEIDSVPDTTNKTAESFFNYQMVVNEADYVQQTVDLTITTESVNEEQINFMFDAVTTADSELVKGENNLAPLPDEVVDETVFKAAITALETALNNSIDTKTQEIMNKYTEESIAKYESFKQLVNEELNKAKGMLESFDATSQDLLDRQKWNVDYTRVALENGYLILVEKNSVK